MPEDYTARLIFSYVVLFMVGFLGIHRFMLGYPLTGLVYLGTGGVMGFGVFMDIWLLP